MVYKLAQGFLNIGQPILFIEDIRQLFLQALGPVPLLRLEDLPDLRQLKADRLQELDLLKLLQFRRCIEAVPAVRLPCRNQQAEDG